MKENQIEMFDKFLSVEMSELLIANQWVQIINQREWFYKPFAQICYPRVQIYTCLFFWGGLMDFLKLSDGMERHISVSRVAV